MIKCICCSFARAWTNEECMSFVARYWVKLRDKEEFKKDVMRQSSSCVSPSVFSLFKDQLQRMWFAN